MPANARRLHQHVLLQKQIALANRPIHTHAGLTNVPTIQCVSWRVPGLISRTIAAKTPVVILHAHLTLLLSVAAHLEENNVAIPTSALLIVPGTTLTNAVLPFPKGRFVQALLPRLNAEIFPAFTTVFVRQKPQVPPTVVLRSLPIRSVPGRICLSSAAHASMPTSVLPMQPGRLVAAMPCPTVSPVLLLLSQSPAVPISVLTIINAKLMLPEPLNVAGTLLTKDVPKIMIHCCAEETRVST